MESNICKELSTILSDKTGLKIDADAVVKSVSRFYYTQEAMPGCAYILHHYRGYFFVEINKEDWEKLEAGEIDAGTFVESTKWFFGYYWGGGSMVSNSGGGYYTQLESDNGIHDKALIQRVMNIIATVGWHFSCGAKVTDEEWEEWREVKRLYLHDARFDYFKIISQYVNHTFGYKVCGFSCDTGYGNDEIVLRSSSFDRTFQLVVSENIIRKLLYGEIAVPDVSDLSSKQFYVTPGYYTSKYVPVHDHDDFYKALEELGIIKEWEDYEERVRKNEDEHKNRLAASTKKETFLDKIKKLFKAS